MIIQMFHILANFLYERLTTFQPSIRAACQSKILFSASILFSEYFLSKLRSRVDYSRHINFDIMTKKDMVEIGDII